MRLGWNYEVRIVGMQLKEGFVKKAIEKVSIFENVKQARDYMKLMRNGNFVCKAKQIPVMK